MLEKMHDFHQTRRGYLTFGILELLLVYIFGSIAIDTASMWAYLATILLLIGAIVNITQAFRNTNQPKPKVIKSKR